MRKRVFRSFLALFVSLAMIAAMPAEASRAFAASSPESEAMSDAFEDYDDITYASDDSCDSTYASEDFGDAANASDGLDDDAFISGDFTEKPDTGDAIDVEPVLTDADSEETTVSSDIVTEMPEESDDAPEESGEVTDITGDISEEFSEESDLTDAIEEDGLTEAYGAATDDKTTGSSSDDSSTYSPLRPDRGWSLIIHVTLYKGQKFDLKNKIKDTYTGTDRIKYVKLTEVYTTSGSKKAVLSYSKSTGIVTAKRTGHTLITGYNKGGGVVYDADFTVIDPPCFSRDGGSTKKTLPILTQKNQELNLRNFLCETSSDSKTYKFTSSQKKIAAINSEGSAVAKKTGTAKITATITGPEKYYKAFKISAKLRILIPSLKKTLTVAPGKKTTLSIKNASGPVQWEWDDDYMYSYNYSTDIRDGVISYSPVTGTTHKIKIHTGSNGGVRKIRAECNDGNILYCTIIVKQFGKRMYKDVGTKGSYNTGNAAKMISGLNSYRKAKGLPALKNDTAMNVKAAVNARYIHKDITTLYYVDGMTLGFYRNNTSKPYAKFKTFKDTYLGGEYESIFFETIESTEYTKVGCGVFYDTGAKKYCTYMLFEK